MLKITIPDGEFYDDNKEEFVTIKGQTLQLEHSLISISNWEAKWHQPFLADREKTAEELLDYIRCMTITQNVDPNIYYNLSEKNIEDINSYIEDKHTATWFSEDEIKRQTQRGGRKGGVITSEIIYYWMTALQIPFECQKWHLNRLLTLVRVCEEKNRPPEKMSKSQIMSRNKALNEARRRALNTKG